MPRIDITETDYTTAALPQYSNFAVVVPGFVDPTKAAEIKARQADGDYSIFDEANIYTVASTEDFDTYIGKYEYTEAKPVQAKAPTLSRFNGKTVKISTVTQEEFYSAPYYVHTTSGDTLYLYVPEVDLDPEDEEGKLKVKLDFVESDFTGDFTTEDGFPDFVVEGSRNTSGVKLDSKAKITTTINYNSKVVITGTAGKKSVKVNDTEYTFTDGTITIEKLAATDVIITQGAGADAGTGDIYITTIEVVKAEPVLYKLVQATKGDWSPTQQYVFVKAGDEGNDYIAAQIGHYGNQIAYELINLGYTVLFLMIDDEVETEEGEIETQVGAYLNKLSSWATWEPLADRSTYDFRYIVSGLRGCPTLGTTNYVQAINNQMSKLATFNAAGDAGRGDCTALLDVNENTYISTRTQKEFVNAVLDEVAGYGSADKYSAIFVPSVVYSYSQPGYTNFTFPATFHYLACAKKSIDNGYQEWHAVAGPQRGICGFNVKSTVGPKLGEVTYNTLEPRRIEDSLSPIQGVSVTKAVNVIAKIKNTYYLYGNRTAHQLKSTDLVASHFLNIRQLCTTIKKQAYTTCKSLVFEPNSANLWINFCNGMRPTLTTMKANEGVFNYKFVKETTEQKAKLKARIEISPVEAVEDFDIDLTLVDNVDGNVTVEETE